jgi:CrcB protein
MKELLLVMAGGAVGSGLRYWVGTLLPVAPGAFPLPTFLVNIVGSFVLGCIIGATMLTDPLHRSLALLLGTGLCGGFTTYSAFAVESVSLLEGGNGLITFTYLSATLIGGMLAAFAGITVVRATAS